MNPSLDCGDAGQLAPLQVDRGHRRAGRGVFHPRVKPVRVSAPRRPGPPATVR